jgi:hypothetical protein
MILDFLALSPETVIAIVPPHLLTDESVRKPPVPVINRWVRLTLLLITVGLVAVLTCAVWLDPYDRYGAPRRLGTHQELGLPPCTFYDLTGKPCPSCGMTTSFALLMHGDVENSLRANAVGTLLALFCLMLIPWNLLCIWRGRLYGIQSLEQAMLWLLFGFLLLLMLRWGIVLLLPV